MHMEEKRLVSLTDSRRALGGIGRTKLYELVGDGQITKVNVGSRSFITADSLERYLDRLVADAQGAAEASSLGEVQ